MQIIANLMTKKRKQILAGNAPSGTPSSSLAYKPPRGAQTNQARTQSLQFTKLHGHCQTFKIQKVKFHANEVLRRGAFALSAITRMSHSAGLCFQLSGFQTILI